MRRRYFGVTDAQAQQPPREDRAELVAPLGGRHAAGVERVRAFHVSVAILGGVVTDQKPPGRPGRDISEEQDA